MGATLNLAVLEAWKVTYICHRYRFPVLVQRCIFVCFDCSTDENKKNKHSDACIYLPPYKLDVLKITYFHKVL